MSITVTMHSVKETPGTVLFKESGRRDGKDRNIYLPKNDFIALGRPATILVTVEAAS